MKTSLPLLMHAEHRMTKKESQARTEDFLIFVLNILNTHSGRKGTAENRRKFSKLNA